MVFDCLTRKELQFLCKRNKIPANITNVAMVDALKALEIVEGLEEFKNQSQSPEKTMNKTSQEIPSTISRTSTRRKPTKEEHQTAQSTVRARKTTRRTAELDEENKNLNVTETPAVTTNTSRRAKKTEPEVKDQRKSDLVETPALQSGRRRPGVGSTRRKVEDTLQTGYGTRRSVRLLGKCMEGLSLNESGKMEPVKVDEMVEGEVQNNNGQSEELPLARNLSASLEDERDLKDDVEENSKCENGGSNGTLISLNEKIDEPEGPKGMKAICF
ncbi:Zinc finger, CCHC-type [Gossypium australe]|uniref:Zinc finger, CCHC-type n=1 Tax=Gossypium australe TaxID=47621 RepID=A0A5B6VRZ9_9ROSI|nr:Zinc finger, CCHC-type [Gossypium australe]